MASKPREQALVERLLVLRAQLGSRDAFGQLVQQYDAPLLFYLRRLVGKTADAEDVRQEVWLTVLRRLSGLEDAAAFRSWLYRIARHRGISWLRKRRREVPLPEAASLYEAVEDDTGEEPAFSPEEAAAVYAALDTLVAAQREILTLRFLGGLSYEDIADVLDCPVGTVRSRLHYAKRALRAAASGLTSPRGDDIERREHA